MPFRLCGRLVREGPGGRDSRGDGAPLQSLRLFANRMRWRREQTTFLSRDQLVEVVWLLFADQISRLQVEPVDAVVDGTNREETDESVLQSYSQ